ncbi:hypothetical protein FRC14_003860 [Serendipita sp. 396]|nr:hypothetical protein FRC14_003860 [Serendipita sp. 396]KAG8789465.1 hypothetical protein FRC15_008322 [Serendipita sp. 397]KAG8804696.1 hypothetical protein FRC16_003586 [Serendipita sp. 398]KAG8879051.1 hypothetical protein FRC20_003810 [Serendipita sp. 405]
MPIPAAVRTALDNLQALKNKNGKKPAVEPIMTESLPQNRATQQQPVPIPRGNGYQSRSHSPPANYLSGSDQSPPRSSTSSKDSNSSGSPPSSTGSRRRDPNFDGSERSSPITPIRSLSQDDHRSIRTSSSLGTRRTDSPVDRERDPVTGKRRSNSDPKQQQQQPQQQQPISVNGRQRELAQSRRSDSPSRPRERESPTQAKFKPSPGSTVSSHHPYSNPSSAASSSMRKLSSTEPASPPPPRQAMAPSQIRARQNNDPPITSILANMSLGGPSGIPLTGPASAALARIQMENAGKRGVIPPHVRKAGSVISATSSSSSSTNSSAREGTVVSDGAFTDYLSDDSDFDLQRQAEIEAENAYQEALRKHEEMEFRQARDSLAGHQIRRIRA